VAARRPSSLSISGTCVCVVFAMSMIRNTAAKKGTTGASSAHFADPSGASGALALDCEPRTATSTNARRSIPPAVNSRKAARQPAQSAMTPEPQTTPVIIRPPAAMQ
jgi:hypothetical protein